MGLPDFRRIAEQHEGEILALARDLVRLDTTNTSIMPTGNETAVATALAAALASHNIETEIDGRVPDRGNLCARLPGQSVRARLVLASHSDVVPAGDAVQWVHPPFGGEVADGHLHGRGAADMKGTVAAQALALILLRRLMVPLAHDVRFVCAADEEAGGAYGMRWVVETHPEWLQADYCINEGGGSFVDINSRDWCLLGVGEKARIEVSATFHGRGAHAARPWHGVNAIDKAAAALARIRAHEPERDVRDPIFESLRGVIGPITPSGVDAVIAWLSRTHPRLADHLRQVSRMVVTPTLISGGVKSNSVPDTCRLTCDVRALPHQGPAYVEEHLRALLPEAEVRIDETAAANASPVSPALTGLLREVLRQVLGREVEVVPTISGGFTDSRLVRPLGVGAYGWTPGHPDSDPSKRRIHGPNEAVAVGDLVVQTAAYMALAHRLAAA